ncbi:MAG: hypothetical protein K2M17_00265 [Bacilli bacterium]|nr:hypothetical protein [Bacilli bacterium]
MKLIAIKKLLFIVALTILSSCDNGETYYYVTDYEVPSLYGSSDWHEQKVQALDKTIGLKIFPNEIQVTAYDMMDSPIIFPDDKVNEIEKEKTVTFIKKANRRYEHCISPDHKYVMNLFVNHSEDDSIVGGQILELKGHCVKYISFEKTKRKK